MADKKNKNQNEERVEARNITLYPSDWTIVEEADHFDLGTSATLRMIIRQWATAQKTQISEAPVPTPA